MARSYGGLSNDWARSIVSDSLGNIYFTGGYRNSIAFDTISFDSHKGSFDFLLVSLDPNGNVRWAKRGGKENYNVRGAAIAIHDDQLFIHGWAGSYQGYLPNITFGELSFISEFDANSFLASYNTSGVQNWVKLIKINNYSWPMYKIDTDPAGNVYIGGSFSDSLRAGFYIVASPNDNDDYYIAKYSPKGELKWLKTSPVSYTGTINIFSLAVFEEDVVLVGGRINNGSISIGGELLETASGASFAGLIGKDIIGCTMELTVLTEDEDFGKKDGTAALTITGGTSPYAIEWSNGDAGLITIDSLFARTYQVHVLDDKGCEQFEVFSVNVKNGPIITLLEKGDVSCHGAADGFINISVSGGTKPYTYLWDNGYTTEDLTNLSAAPYAVTVIDAKGLAVSTDYLVTEPKGLDVSYTIKEASCGGGTDGSINVFTSGGTKDYDWEWNTKVYKESLINLGAGSYSLIVKDAHNCELEVEIALSEQGAPVVETEYVYPANCNMSDGAAKVRVMNASGSEMFEWSNGKPILRLHFKGQGAILLRLPMMHHARRYTWLKFLKKDHLITRSAW